MLEWMFVGTLGGLGAVVLMGLEALNCLLTCRGKRRTRLLYAAAGLGIVLLLWGGGCRRSTRQTGRASGRRSKRR